MNYLVVLASVVILLLLLQTIQCGINIIVATTTEGNPAYEITTRGKEELFLLLNDK